VFQSTLSIVEENTTFGVSRQFRANSTSAGVASGCWPPVFGDGHGVPSGCGEWAEQVVVSQLRPLVSGLL
jgi:hypothetical protein